MKITTLATTLFLTALTTVAPQTLFAAEPATTPAAMTSPTPALTPAGTLPIKTPETVTKPMKIGYINITRIGQESKIGKSVKSELLKKKDALGKKVLAKRKALDKLKQKIEGEFASLSPKQKEAKSKDFQKKVEAFQKFAQNAESEFIKAQESETARVYGIIEKAVSEYGKGSDLSLIIVKKELLYLAAGVDTEDVTDKIMNVVNEGDKKP